VISSQSLSRFLVLYLTAAAVWAQYPTQPAIQSPTTESVVARMIEARTESRNRLRPYQVLRNYKLFGKDRQKTKSEVAADITFVPPDVQQYIIHKIDGLGLGEVIVRKILESENELLTNRSASDISKANYDFRLIREDTLNSQPCYVLEIRLLRKHTNLLRGVIWVDASTYLPHRIEGEPAKPPSWWVHDIHVTLDFQDVHGMWLQTALLSTANVRLLGPHTIVSRDMEYRMGGLEAGVRAVSHENE
jgi:hypothetical protein